MRTLFVDPLFVGGANYRLTDPSPARNTGNAARVPADPSVPRIGYPPEATPARVLYLFSGEFHLEAEDMRIKGRGLDFVWARKYRSRLGPTTELGNGWDYSYDLRVVVDAWDHLPDTVRRAVLAVVRSAG